VCRPLCLAEAMPYGLQQTFADSFEDCVCVMSVADMETMVGWALHNWVALGSEEAQCIFLKRERVTIVGDA
jgi:hypothetical protein